MHRVRVRVDRVLLACHVLEDVALLLRAGGGWARGRRRGRRRVGAGVGVGFGCAALLRCECGVGADRVHEADDLLVLAVQVAEHEEVERGGERGRVEEGERDVHLVRRQGG